MNILIYYMPKLELRMQRYGASNRSIWAENFRDLEKIRSTLKTDLDRGGARSEVAGLSPELLAEGGGRTGRGLPKMGRSGAGEAGGRRGQKGSENTIASM